MEEDEGESMEEPTPCGEGSYNELERQMIGLLSVALKHCDITQGPLLLLLH